MTMNKLGYDSDYRPKHEFNMLGKSPLRGVRGACY